MGYPSEHSRYWALTLCLGREASMRSPHGLSGSEWSQDGHGLTETCTSVDSHARVFVQIHPTTLKVKMQEGHYMHCLDMQLWFFLNKTSTILLYIPVGSAPTALSLNLRELTELRWTTLSGMDTGSGSKSLCTEIPQARGMETFSALSRLLRPYLFLSSFFRCVYLNLLFPILQIQNILHWLAWTFLHDICTR